MTAFTRDIRAIAALEFAAAAGIVADVWQAEGRAGGGGHYLSPDPRMVVFLGPRSGFAEGSGPVGIADTADGPATARLAFVPAGVPVWTRVHDSGAFRHLDLHVGPQAIAAFRGLGVDLPGAPVLLDSDPVIDGTAGMLAREVTGGRCDPALLQTLAAAILAGFRRAAPQSGAPHAGGLTPVQHRRVADAMRRNLHRSLTVAELAAEAGLSESWFARAFRATTGQTPARALAQARIDAAKAMLSAGTAPLAEIAAATGFADQAHFTRAFRAATGTTPAVWRAAARDG